MKGPQDVSLQCKWGTCGAPKAEDHQGDLYERDTEMVESWFVYGRGPAAGARHAWETAYGRAEVSVYRLPDDSGTIVESIGARAAQILVPDAVLLAVGERAASKTVPAYVCPLCLFDGPVSAPCRCPA